MRTSLGGMKYQGTLKMKNLLLLLLFPVIVFGFGSLIEKQIDTITPPSGTVTLNGSVVMDSGTADTVPYLNGSKVITSSSVTSTELGYVSGVTSALQTQLDAKVNDTGDEVVAGIKNFSSELLIDQITTPANPAAGKNKIYSKSDDSLYILTSGGVETEVGGTTDLTTDVTGILPLANGGTGSATRNFVDLTSSETVAGVKTFSSDILMSGTGQLDLPVGTTGERSGSPTSGMIRFNSTDVTFEGYDGTLWGPIGGSVDLSAIDQDIIPDTNDTYDIGSASKNFVDGYIDNIFSNKIEVVSATESSIPCPRMTKTQMEAISSPTNGSCVFNETDGAQFHYDSTLVEWVIAGSVVNVENITDWVDYTPTITGHGTVASVDFKYRRVGDSVEVHGKWTNGTPTAVESQIGLPSGLTIDSSKMATIKNVGYLLRAVADTAAVEYLMLSTGGDTYFNIGKRQSSVNPINPITGTSTLASEVLTFFATVPISGWSASTKYATSTCTGLECFNEFSARIDNNGTCTVTSENLDFIDSCTRNSAGITTVTWVSGFFPVVPSVVITSEGDKNSNINIVQTTTSVQILTANRSTDALVDGDYSIKVQRQGSDFFDHDERFIEVNDQRYSVNLSGNDGRAITADTEDIHFSGSGTGWTSTGDTHYYTVQNANSVINLTGMTKTTTSLISTALELYKNGSLYRRIEQEYEGTAIIGILGFMYNSTEGEFVSGDQLSIRINRSATLNNVTTTEHYLNIVETLQPKAYVGNLNPKTLVETPGSNLPKMYSAELSATGVVSSEYSNWINGNCTNASPSVCTLESSAFVTGLNCTINAEDSAVVCGTTALSISSLSFTCYTTAGSDVTTARTKNLICHGE